MRQAGESKDLAEIQKVEHLGLDHAILILQTGCPLTLYATKANERGDGNFHGNWDLAREEIDLPGVQCAFIATVREFVCAMLACRMNLKREVESRAEEIRSCNYPDEMPLVMSDHTSFKDGSFSVASTDCGFIEQFRSVLGNSVGVPIQFKYLVENWQKSHSVWIVDDTVG